MSGLTYLVLFAAGAIVAIAVARMTRVSLSSLTAVTLLLFVVGIFAFRVTYRDERCDENTACRLIAGPSFVFFYSLVPGMGAGLIVVGLWRAAERSGSRERGG